MDIDMVCMYGVGVHGRIVGDSAKTAPTSVTFGARMVLGVKLLQMQII
jgi:hypothetical protein